ncbi:Polypeptide N-acetylgalactosaminyltransferase 18, partial [Crenichthys baileyi]
AEPVLLRIKEDRTRIISLSFDNIKYDTFEIEEYPLSAQGFDWELWCRYLNPPKSWWHRGNKSAPIQSPALIGCFVVDRLYFEEIGLLDEGMEVYGGENVELGIRKSLSASSILVMPPRPAANTQVGCVLRDAFEQGLGSYFKEQKNRQTEQRQYSTGALVAMGLSTSTGVSSDQMLRE